MTSVDLERRAVRECGKPKRQQVDRERIVRLWEEETWTQLDIANICNCSIPTVRRVLLEEGFQATYDGDGWGFKKMLHKRAEELRGTRCQKSE